MWHFHENIRYLQRTNLSFDFYIPEIFGPFIHGGAIISMPTADERDMEAIQNKIESEYVTHVDCVTSMFTAFYHLDPTFEKLKSLDTLNVGGEAPTAELSSSIVSGPLSDVLVHAYGPSEGVTITHFGSRGPHGKASLSVGPLMPYRNQAVIDEHWRVLPPAMEGELCVGGLIQCRGYKNLPGRTAAGWIPNECGRPGSRMYRTGDLSIIHPDGEVQILGRYCFFPLFFLIQF